MIYKVKNALEQVVMEKENVAEVNEDFYRKLYTQFVLPPYYQEQLWQTILNMELNEPELRAALKQQQNCKAPGEGHIPSEMMEAGGETLILISPNECLLEGRIHKSLQKQN